MRITKHTDYALRILLYLAARGDGRVSTQAIAEAYGISTAHLLKVTRRLGEIGVLSVYRGAHGGVELACAPDEISVGAVMRAFDDRDALIECFDMDANTCVIAPSCGLKDALRGAQEAFYAKLDSVTVGALVARRAAKLRTLTE